jgi:hypothetical protein
VHGVHRRSWNVFVPFKSEPRGIPGEAPTVEWTDAMPAWSNRRT